MGSKPKGPDYGEVTDQLRSDTDKLLTEQKERSARQGRQTEQLDQRSEQDFREFTNRLASSIQRDLNLDKAQQKQLTSFMSLLNNYQRQEVQRARSLRQEQGQRFRDIERGEAALLSAQRQFQRDVGEEQLLRLEEQGEISRQQLQLREQQLQREVGLQEGITAEQRRQEADILNRVETERLQQGIQQRTLREQAREGFLSAQAARRRETELRDLRRNL